MSKITEQLLNSVASVHVNVTDRNFIEEISSSIYHKSHHDVLRDMAKYSGIDYITEEEKELLSLGYEL